MLQKTLTSQTHGVYDGTYGRGSEGLYNVLNSLKKGGPISRTDPSPEQSPHHSKANKKLKNLMPAIVHSQEFNINTASKSGNLTQPNSG